MFVELPMELNLERPAAWPNIWIWRPTSDRKIVGSSPVVVNVFHFEDHERTFKIIKNGWTTLNSIDIFNHVHEHLILIHIYALNMIIQSQNLTRGSKSVHN